MYVYVLLISSYESEVYTEWVEGVDAIAKTNLEKPLLVRGKKEAMASDLIRVNFDPQVYTSTLADCQVVHTSTSTIYSVTQACTVHVCLKGNVPAQS